MAFKLGYENNKVSNMVPSNKVQDDLLKVLLPVTLTEGCAIIPVVYPWKNLLDHTFKHLIKLYSVCKNGTKIREESATWL